MSEPTLTEKQMEALRVALRYGGCDPYADGERLAAVVAAMLADEHAAREAAEAKVRDLIAAVWALAKEHDRLFGDCYATSSVRRLLDDSDAALAEVRAEARREALRDLRRLAVRCYPKGMVPTALVIADIEERIDRAEADGAGR